MFINSFNTFSTGPFIETFVCVDLCEGLIETVNATVNWTLSGGDSADSYLINITTNASHVPYGGFLKITTANVTQHKLTGFCTNNEYKLTLRGICGGQEGSESEPLTITPQGMCILCTALQGIFTYKPWPL